jgi:GTP-binding protein Era
VTNIAEKLANHPARKILVLNKVDIATKERLLPHVEKLHALAAFEETFFISALTGDGLEQLRQWLMAAMPEGAWHYPEDQASDVSQRLMAAEITREQIFQRLHAELPYAAAVTTEKYSERADGSVEIHQQILIERSSQRAIILGKGGQQLRSIGEAARKEIADLLGSRVHLYLHVKVSAKWTEDRSLYRDMGMDWVD